MGWIWWLGDFRCTQGSPVRGISLHCQHQTISNPIFAIYRSNIKLSTIKILQVTDNFFLCFIFFISPRQRKSVRTFCATLGTSKVSGGRRRQKGKIRRIIEKLFIISINHKRENSFSLLFPVMTFLLTVSF